MNRPARFTQADLARALRVARQAGPEYAVEIAPDGTIRIVRHLGKIADPATKAEQEEEIVL